MKIIVLICLGILSSSSIMAQKISLNDRVNIQLPSKIERISSDNLAVVAKQNDIKLAVLPNSENKSTYVKDDVIITLFASKKKEQVDLVKLKKGLDEWGKTLAGYSSKIIEVNGNKFLITQNNTESKIRFYGTNPEGTTSVNGLLEFNERSKSKASTTLESLMPSISFDK